jgi:hypothetical protein
MVAITRGYWTSKVKNETGLNCHYCKGNIVYGIDKTYWCEKCRIFFNLDFIEKLKQALKEKEIKGE